MAPQTVACQAPLSMEFSRQEWSKLLFPTPRDLPDPGMEPHLLYLLHRQAGSLPLVHHIPIRNNIMDRADVGLTTLSADVWRT